MLILSLLACRDVAAPEPEVPQASLSIDDPAPDAFVAAGPVTVRGEASGLDPITVDGVPVSSVDGAWEAEIVVDRGVHTFEVAGVDGHGDVHFERRTVLAGAFVEPGPRIESAALMRVNRPGIDWMLDYAQGMITGIDLMKKVEAMNPVYEDTYGVLGWDAVTIKADVTDLRYSAITLSAIPSNGALTFNATIQDLEADVRAYGDVIGIDFDTEAWFWASAASLDAMLTIDAVDGSLDVAIAAPTVDLIGFGYDTSLLPGEVEAYLFVDTIEQTLEEMVLEQIEALVPPMIEELLGGLSLSFETELLGTTVSIAASFAEAAIDPDGLALTVDVSVDLPSAGTLASAGYLTTGPVTPDLDREAPITAAVSDDLMNAVLHEVWRAGLVSLTLSTDDGTLDALMLAPLHAEQGTIGVSAALPPVVLEREGALYAEAGGLGIDISTPGGELGAHLVIDAAGGLPLTVGIDGELLTLSLGTPELALTVTESDWGASNEATTLLVETMLPIDVLMLLVPDLEFPLPTFEGIHISEAEVVRDANRAHTDLHIWLDGP